MKAKTILLAGFLFTGAILLAGCSFGASTVERWHHTAGETTAAVTETIEKSTVVLSGIDKENLILSFKSISTGENLIYSYTQATEVLTRSGVATTIDGISPGQIVDLSYDAVTHVVETVQVTNAEDVWENTKVTSFSIDEVNHSMKIGQTLYSYNSELLVFSENKQIDVMELTSADQLIVRGHNNCVDSIVVDKGHGYISLSGETVFIGGLIDVDGVIVKIIEDDMLLLVTEGTYKVKVTNGAYDASKYVTVSRNEESIVDFSDVPVIVQETGSVKFIIDNSDAVLYVDGVVTDPLFIQNYEYGTHTVKVTCEGYEDYSQTINVDTAYEEVTITLNSDETAEEETTVSETETTGEETSGDETTIAEEETTLLEGETYVSELNDVNVYGPEGALVFFDGSYMGVAPVTFDMITGEHVITVFYNQSIKSFTVNLAEGEGTNDCKYDFSNNFN